MIHSKRQVKVYRYRYYMPNTIYMAEVAEPQVKPAETEAPAKDPKFSDFMKTVLDDKKEPELPKQYACVLHNDPTTDAFLVAAALAECFALSNHRAMEIMMAVHRGTRGVIAIYAKDEAQTRTDKAMTMVHEAGFKDFSITVEEE